jgi:hypothetical protein
MMLTPHAQKMPGTAGLWGEGGPLWQRVPKRDATGRPYIDFMMFAPRLNQRPAREQESVALLLRGVLAGYQDRVVFAELNLKINVLWVSLENRPGLMSELVAVLRIKLPEFHLVAHNPHAGI